MTPAEQMREAAAKACDKIAGNTRDFNKDHRRAAGQCAAMIRAMPLPLAPPLPDTVTVPRAQFLDWADRIDRDGRTMLGSSVPTEMRRIAAISPCPLCRDTGIEGGVPDFPGDRHSSTFSACDCDAGKAFVANAERQIKERYAK